jgi:uncharacterized membrane protein SpoIIM required for sporulation
VLVAAWAALVLAVTVFVIGFLQQGVILLYAAILASAAAMTLVVGYLLRGRAGADRPIPGAARRRPSRRKPASARPGRPDRRG